MLTNNAKGTIKMNKLFIMTMTMTMALTLGASLYGADQPKDSPKDSPKDAPKERLLTRDEALELQVTVLKANHLNEQFKISDYQTAMAPISKKQQELHDSLCTSIGVPKDKLATGECQISGFDSNGDPINGPDGKPVPQKVYRIAPPVTSTK